MYTRTNYIRSILWILFLSMTFVLGISSGNRYFIQKGIAEKVLRFHILANSDSCTDQEIKLEIRDAVLTWAEEHGETISDKQTATAFFEQHTNSLENIADQILEKHSCSYRSRLSLKKSYFPPRKYGKYTFPSGWYDSVSIELGNGEGHNWWCILYPEICFGDCLHGQKNNSEEVSLKNTLTAQEYEALLWDWSSWKIMFRWF